MVQNIHSEIKLVGTLEEWMFVGKYRAHFKPITGLLFVDYKSELSLISIAEDRFLVEYDLANSTASTGLIVKVCIKLKF